jgi:anti-sigma B factor antagonist
MSQSLSAVKAHDRTAVPGAIEFAVSVTSADGVTVVEVAGDLDCFTSPQLRSTLLDLAEDAPELVVLDLGHSTFVDSTALGVLVGGLKRLREAGGDMVLRSLTPTAVRLFQVTGMSKLFRTA